MGIDSTIPYYKMPAGDKFFAIPEMLVKRPILLDSIMEKIHEHAKAYQQTMEEALKYTGDSEKLRRGLVESFDRSIRVSDEAVRIMLLNDMKVMFQLIDSGDDSIWSYILKNILRPIALISRKFHFIIGNPPWLAIQFMMNSKYKSFLKEETFKFNLIDKNDTHLFSHIEMATLFFCKISELYLEDGGKIAFVMPKSVLTARHHANFIKLEFKNNSTRSNLQLRLDKIFNLEGVNPLFNVPCCVLIADKGAKTVFPVKMISMTGLLNTRNDKWSVAKSHLALTKSDFILNFTGRSTTGDYYKLFFNGATIYPRNFWFVSFITHPTFGFNPNLPYVRSDEGNDTKKPWDKVLVEGNVEVESLYATLIGRDILPFGYKRIRPVVLPIIIKDNTIILFNSHNDASTNNLSKLSQYLKRVEIEWNKYANLESKKYSVYEWLNYRNKLTNQNPNVSFRVLYVATATFLAACVVSIKDPLIIDVEGKAINLKAFIVDTKTWCYDTDDEMEAYYLCSILNSKIVDDWIKPLQNKGQWGERDIHRRPLMLPIPSFQHTDRRIILR